MKLTFDYYNNLEQVDLYLCNPDGRELFVLPGRNRNLVLRFNDLSELTFEVGSEITLSTDSVMELEAYDYIQTKRLVYATNIGWFQISGVEENDNGLTKYKTVTAESYQSVLKNKGFYSEGRVYCFYNPNDPRDERYDASQDDSLPSVLGQWNKQLGIQFDLTQGLAEPSAPYDDWTVTYIHQSLIYTGSGSVCRTFEENTTFGYDWIVNNVEEAFGVIVLFDFMYKTIHVMLPSEVTQQANVVYSFNNFMKSISVNENADDIVTVLNCNGNNCNIMAVNPTGTNYICDFSYYMDEVNHRWMSANLITKLKGWKEACNKKKSDYEDLIKELRRLYQQATEKETLLKEASLALADLKTAQSKRLTIGNDDGAGGLCGIVAAENVTSYRTTTTSDTGSTETTVIGGNSIKPGTPYYVESFTGNATITAYRYAPKYNKDKREWEWGDSNSSTTKTADDIVAGNLNDSESSYWYFSDVSDGSSYCKLKSATTVNADTKESVNYCGGFTRYIAYTYPTVDKTTGKVIFFNGIDPVQEWIGLHEQRVKQFNKDLCGYGFALDGYDYTQTVETVDGTIAIITESGGRLSPTDDSIYGQINQTNAAIEEIAGRLNIFSYFADSPTLLRELNCYWIEGDYTNDNIAVQDTTTPEEEIDLSNQLLQAGYTELSKVCQPRLSFTIESVDATKQYEFRDQMRELELGKVVTIEKEDGVWYTPALLEISINLDNSDDFSMSFANKTRLDDWGYTYADLISDASSTSRKVSANWQNMLAYSNERDEITSLLQKPLDTALRAASANAVNQSFTVGNDGILGRKRISAVPEASEESTSDVSSDFDPEQVRLINNMLIFTDDNWQTARAAIGKVSYTDLDEDGKEVTKTSYGIVADAIIGSLLMGKRLSITNEDNSVTIGEDGITIKNGNEVVFNADTEGNLTVKNYLRTFGGAKYQFAWKLNEDGFELYSGNKPVMEVDKAGNLSVTGKITATSGKIGGFTLTKVTGESGGVLYTGDMTSFDYQYSETDEKTGIYIGPEGILMRGDYTDRKRGCFWVNKYGQMCVEMGVPGSQGRFFSFDFDGFRVHNGLKTNDENFVDIGLIPGAIQVYNPKNETSALPICFECTDSRVIGRLEGTWYVGNSALATTSWRGAKENIEELPESYETLFDNLTPVRFQYIDGTSGRYHTGFILDDLKAAMDAAGLSSKEVGAYCIDDESIGSGGIRYEELIAICVRKIQRLESEINKLKNQSAECEETIV